MNEPLETAELLAFAKTVEAKSLSRAAAELRVPRATISRRLARLEERLAVRLLRRTTRSLVLTDAGDALYRHARIVLDAVAHAESSVRRTDDVIRGDLRVSAPPMLNQSFHDLFVDFARRYPAVRLQVHLSTQVVDLARGDYDVAIRAGTQIQPGLVARTLVRDPVIAVASPAYLANEGVPRTRRDLRDHRCLMGFARGEVPQTHWPVGRGLLHVEGAFFTNDMTLLCAAALQGLGIALVPSLLVRALVDSGELVHVLPGALGGESHVAVVYPEREFVPPAVRAFVDAVAAWAKTNLTKESISDDCQDAHARRKRVQRRQASRRSKAA
ncbi:MAG TPA: LysR family transcriptional regulator [Polyangia bacterium]|jgi:DNA-binding transcriptional LysR family regulator|nr:LysR family transcriptional regulator [Polyangia bacterium]